MPKVSVIVPIYNVEKYLKKCLESLKNQTLQNIEIILVDDGSQDGSSQIAKKFQEENQDKVFYYRTENKGQSHARNFGVEHALGEYIAFVDSDDYVENTMLEKMVEKLQEYPYDIVCCQTLLEYPDIQKEVKCGVEKDYKELTLEDKKHIIQSMYPVVWNKIYKKEWLQKVPKMEEGIWFEDVLFLYEVIPFIQSMAIVDEAFYHYVQRPKSITYTYSEKLYDIFMVFDILVTFYKQKGLYEEYRDILEFEYVRYAYATFIRRLAKAKDKQVFKKGVEFAIAKVNSKFPNYKRNPYIRKWNPKCIYLRFFNPFIANRIFDMDKNKMN